MIGILIGAVGAAASVCAWIVMASFVYCRLSGHAALFVFPFTQWLDAAPYWATTGSTKAHVLISAAAACAPFVAVARNVRARRKLRRPMGGGLKPLEVGVTDNHGHASWLSVEEMLKLYCRVSPSHGAVVMGEARRIDLEDVRDVPFDPRDKRTWGHGGKAQLLLDDGERGSPHSVICVGTGGLKTMHAVSTQVYWTGSVITFDPSTEIGPMVRKWREHLGQRVIFIGKDKGQQGINALDCIQPGKPDAASRILSMTASICGEEPNRNDKNSVFDSAGRNLIAALLAHMMYDSSMPDDQKTIETLVKGITVPEDTMQNLLRGIHATSESHQARQLAGIVMGTHKETFSGAYFSATQYAGWLLDPENARLLSGTLKPSEILQGDLSIYIQIPTGSLIYVPGPGGVITHCLVSSIIQADGNYAQRILLQADEARLLGNMKSLEVVLLQGRKYGLTLNMIYTSINDMKRVWTEDGLETWMDNAGWFGFAAVSSKTAEQLSKMIGKRGVMAYSEGDNRGLNSKGLLSDSSSKGSNTSYHEIGRPLILPEEFKDCRSDEMFILPRTGRAFRCGMAPYFRRPEMVKVIEQTSFSRQSRPKKRPATRGCASRPV